MWVVVVLLILALCGVVGLSMRNARRAARVSDDQIEQYDIQLSHEARVAIGSAIAGGNMLLAIKTYRDSTGADLATSRAAVSRWAKGIR